MIVVDTNTIAYLFLPTEHTNDIERLLDQEGHWAAPLLWRSEFRNILALYIRKKLIDMETALMMQAQAEDLLNGNEYQIQSDDVIQLAHASGCSAYDCEFVSIANALNAPLITADKKILRQFPKIAMTASTYLGFKK